MRYYAIDIQKPDGTPFFFKSLNGNRLSSLLPSGSQMPMWGKTNIGALNIEFDLPVANQTDPSGGSYVRVWGLGLADIKAASNLNGCYVTISGGMAKGLPLANPKQAGKLLYGVVSSGFGNWVGTEMSVDMIFVGGGPATGNTSIQTGNFPFVWPAHTPLASAIAQTLSTGLPGVPQQINIRTSLVTNSSVTGQYTSLQQFADWLNKHTKDLIPNYPGVMISINNSTISVADDSPAQAAIASPSTNAGLVKPIAFQDLIGQPTWLTVASISVQNRSAG